MLLYLSLAAVFSTVLAFVFGQDTTAIPLSLKKCPVQGSKELTYEISLDKADDGSTSFSLSADLAQAMQGCTYTANIDIKNGGIYVYYIQMIGNVCEVFDNVGKPAWERFKKAVKPPIEAPCTINAGSYSISGFHIKKDEVNFSSASKGQFRTDVHLYCNNVEVACVLAEVLIEEDEDEDDEW